MGTRGLVYRVTTRRADGGWIEYRTCDRHEASSMAQRLGGLVETV